MWASTHTDSFLRLVIGKFPFQAPYLESDRMSGFTKSQRLLSKKDFETSFDGSGLKQVCGGFVLVASRPRTGKQTRLGLVVSGKVGNSVVRNRVKRSVREVFRNELARMPALSGRDLVVIARPSLVDQKGDVKTDLRDSLRHCVGRLVKRLNTAKTLEPQSEPC